MKENKDLVEGKAVQTTTSHETAESVQVDKIQHLQEKIQKPVENNGDNLVQGSSDKVEDSFRAGNFSLHYML